MQSQNGWITLHRKILEWEWWDDHNTSRLFIYLLLKANHETKSWQGLTIERGQLVTGLHSLKAGTGISVRSLRTSLNKLESTGELTRKTTNKYSIITITHYDEYQSRDSKPTSKTTSKLTSKRQATDKQPTTNNNENNVTNKQSIYTSKFEEFWTAYPSKVGKKSAFRAFQRAKDKPEVSVMVEKIKLQMLTDQWQKGFIPHPTTWLNQGRWDDKIDPTIKPKKSLDEELAEWR